MARPLNTVPVAPGRWPLLGHVPRLLRDSLRFVPSLRDTGDIVRVDIGTWPVYFLTTPALVRQTLVEDARHFVKGRIFQWLRVILGQGLVTSDGDPHLRQRRLMQPMFRRDRIDGYAEIMSARAAALADSWRPGQTIDMDKAMVDLAANTIATALFSAELADHAVTEIQRDIPLLVKNLLVRTVMPKFLDRLPIPANRRYDQAAAQVRHVIDEVIADYHAHPEQRDDLLSLLMAARDDTGAGMSDTQIRDEVVTILFAGTETTSVSMSCALYELARHPDVGERVHAEIDTVVGGHAVTRDHVRKLTYLNQILQEVTRLHTLLLIMRQSRTEVTMGGVRLPPGTEVVYSPYALHRDPRSFPEPERFDPDRWLPERAATIPAGAYLPFGAGNRMCIGDTFAWTEMTIALAEILRRWRPQLAEGSVPREVPAGVVQLNALPMTVHPRPTTRTPPIPAEEHTKPSAAQ